MLVCGPLLSTAIVSAGRTASKAGLTDNSGFAEAQQSDPQQFDCRYMQYVDVEHLNWIWIMWEQMTRKEFMLKNYEQFLTARPSWIDTQYQIANYLTKHASWESEAAIQKINAEEDMLNRRKQERKIKNSSCFDEDLWPTSE